MCGGDGWQVVGPDAFLAGSPAYVGVFIVHEVLLIKAVDRFIGFDGKTKESACGPVYFLGAFYFGLSYAGSLTFECEPQDAVNKVRVVPDIVFRNIVLVYQVGSGDLNSLLLHFCCHCLNITSIGADIWVNGKEEVFVVHAELRLEVPESLIVVGSEAQWLAVLKIDNVRTLTVST